MFLAAVSGGLVALGLVATASSLGAAFYGFALVLLPTLALIGFVTFERALQGSIEDTEYARRIALLRGYYFGHAPEIAPYLLSVPRAERLLMQRVPGDRWQGYRTVAGMVGVTPSGLGVREGVMAALLHTRFGLGNAAALAVALRGYEFVIELVWLAVASALARRVKASAPARSGSSREG